MRSQKLNTLIASGLALVLVLPTAVNASESSERFAKGLEKVDCAKFNEQMRSFLQQNRANIIALEKMPAKKRKETLQSFYKTFEKAESVNTKCAAGKEKETDALLRTSGSHPQHVSGLYPRLTATLEFAIQNDANDPYLYEQLTKGYDELLSAYSLKK